MKNKAIALIVALCAICCFIACDGSNASGNHCVHEYENACDATCNKCGEVRSVEGHDYKDGYCIECGAECEHLYAPTGLEPSCTEELTEVHRCEICGYTFTSVISPAGHLYDDDEDTTCNRCEYVRESGAPCVHEYDNACDKTCNKCGEIRSVEGHDYKDGYCTKCGAECEHLYAPTGLEPSCTEELTEVHRCDICGYTYTSILTPAGHIYDDDSDTDCNKCGAEREIVTPPGEVITITTEQELRNIALNREGNYVLGNDITVTGVWKTICNGDEPFKGTLDGKGHSISDMTVKSDLVIADGSAIDYLVGMIGENKGTIKNIVFKNFRAVVTADDINATAYKALKAESAEPIETLDVHAGIVGQNKGIMENITAAVEISVIPATSSARVRVGAIAAKSTGNVTKCVSTGTISAVCSDGYVRAGGLIGYLSGDAEVKNCESAVTIDAKNTDAKMNLGGLIGNIECGKVDQCFAKGNITAQNVNKAVYAGGLIGLIDNTSGKYDEMSVSVTGCYAAGNVTSQSSKGSLGGLIGEINATVSASAVLTIENNAAKGATNGAKKATGFLAVYEIFDAAGTALKLPVPSAYSSMLRISGNSCAYSDSVANVVSRDSIVIPSTFVLA